MLQGETWAVGQAGSQTLIENWNGTAWTVVPSPSVTGTLAGVSTIGSLRAVGRSAGGAPPTATLVETTVG